MGEEGREKESEWESEGGSCVVVRLGEASQWFRASRALRNLKNSRVQRDQGTFRNPDSVKIEELKASQDSSGRQGFKGTQRLQEVAFCKP
ncbi:hypothetical protein E2C01_066852 [Portunus trituberculatus]|uniref:Uncharacterized protein n=1 Tax=Portunus trituberculatus TaxID=210409 RepID=A0A5B7HI91_PORTR|nr:hypothetical protein [Portunus trituberculatus]